MDTSVGTAAALEAAEGGVAAFYAIRPREWSLRFRYDLGAASDHPELVFARHALAQIVRAEPLTPRRLHRWRIILRPDEIARLGALLGEDTVLTYALAHELVHLVRFASGLASFDLAEALRRREEEARVRRIARAALRPVLGPGAREALDILSRGPGAEPGQVLSRTSVGANPV